MRRPEIPSRVPSLSDQIADLVRRSGRTPAAICAAARINPSVLSRFLSGARSIDLSTADRLAAALGGLRLVGFGTPRRRGQARPTTAEAPEVADAGDEPAGPGGPREYPTVPESIEGNHEQE